MSYISALEAAGAVVHNSKYFGSYQGDWWAKVTYKGVTGWVHGAFGSCCCCDAFESEFDYEIVDYCKKHKYSADEECPECYKTKTKSTYRYNRRLIEFGEGYLNDMFTQEEAMKHASKELDWDMEAEDMVKFIEDNAI